MLDVKKWLEFAGEPVAETCFTPGEVPPLPYIIFLDSTTTRGADEKNLIKSHTLRIERYAVDSEYNATLESLINAKGEFTKEKQWIKDDDQYMTIYEIDFTEKF